jgi:uncharacterized protein
MYESIRSNRKMQLTVSLGIGILFGFLLQKGGVTRYDVIIGQLLLKDWTVVKIMLSAVITGTLGVHALHSLKLVQLHPKPGSIGTSLIGGLIFGIGFAVLGYCPGTAMGAVGQGSLDAIAGIAGIIIGAGLFAAFYSKLKSTILQFGEFGDLTIPRYLRVNEWIVVIPAAIMLIALLAWLEVSGL